MKTYLWFLLIQNTFTLFPVLALKCYISDYESCLTEYQEKIRVLSGFDGSISPPSILTETDREKCYDCLQNIKPKIMLCERECLCTTIVIQTSGMTETPTIKLLDYNNETCAKWKERKYASTCIKNWYSTNCETCTEDLCNKNKLTDGVTEEVTQRPLYNPQLKCYKNDWKSCKDGDVLKCYKNSRLYEENCEQCAKVTFTPIGEESFSIADCSSRNMFCELWEKYEKNGGSGMTNCQNCGSKLCNKPEQLKKSNKALKETGFGIFMHILYNFFILHLY